MHRIGATWLASLLLVTAACTTRVSGGQDGSGGEAAKGCDAPDTVCPAVKPHPGGPCSGALSCDYQEGPVAWSFTCQAGRWSGQADCSMIVGACGIPEPAEPCSSPFSGTLEGASLAVGPADLGAPFRSFETGEVPEVVWGAQGNAMVFFRVQIDGADVPSCVRIDTTVAAEGVLPETAGRAVRLRCGESLGMYVIVPYGECGGTELVPTTLTVAAQGIGSSEIELMVPPEAFCPVL